MNELLERMDTVDKQRKELADEVATMMTQLFDTAIEKLGVKIEIGDYDYNREDSEFCADYTIDGELVIVCRC